MHETSNSSSSTTTTPSVDRLPFPMRRNGSHKHTVRGCVLLGVVAVAIAVMIGATTQMLALYTNVSNLRYWQHQVVATINGTVTSDHLPSSPHRHGGSKEPTRETNYMLDLVLDVLRQDADLQTQNGSQDGAKQLLDQGKEDAASVFLAGVVGEDTTPITNTTILSDESTVSGF